MATNTTIEVTWTTFKAFLSSRNITVPIQYLNINTNYYLYAFDGPFSVTCIIPQASPATSDQSDFETNYKNLSTTNTRINPDVLSYSGAIRQQHIGLQATATTSNPGDQPNGELVTLITDEEGRLNVIQQDSNYTAWGQGFLLGTNVQYVNTINETPLLLISNPSNSGLILRLNQISFDSPLSTGDGNIYRVYSQPTVSANGTALTPVGCRQIGQAPPATNIYLMPTVSSNGTFLGAKVVGYGADVNIEYNYSVWLEPGYSLLVTVQLSQSNGSCGAFIQYVEE